MTTTPHKAIAPSEGIKVEGAPPQLAFDPRHLKEWKLDPSRLIFTDRLGAGTSAKVYKGRYDNNPVAIKLLNLSDDAKLLKDFEYECALMSAVRSDHVLHFYGTLLVPKVCIVVEYCPRGTLFQCISDPTNDISWAKVLKWCVEIAVGLKTLHTCSPAVLHRDLKTLNLLLARDGSIKLCDFGKSRLAPVDESNKDATLGKIRGTYAYSAPEVYFGEQFTIRSDVYSIGVVLWELLYRCIRGVYQRPYGEYPNIVAGPMLLIKSAKQNLRPTLPPETPKEYGDLVQACWHPKPSERPDANRILEILGDLRTKYEEDSERRNQWEGLRRGVPRRTPESDASVSGDEGDRGIHNNGGGWESSASEIEDEEDEDEDDELLLSNARLARRTSKSRRRRSWLQSLREPLTSEDMRDLKEFEQYYSKYGIVQLRHSAAIPTSPREGEEQAEPEDAREDEPQESTSKTTSCTDNTTSSPQPQREDDQKEVTFIKDTARVADLLGHHSPPSPGRGLERWRRKEDVIARTALLYENEKAARRVQQHSKVVSPKVPRADLEEPRQPAPDNPKLGLRRHNSDGVKREDKKKLNDIPRRRGNSEKTKEKTPRRGSSEKEKKEKSPRRGNSSDKESREKVPRRGSNDKEKEKEKKKEKSRGNSSDKEKKEKKPRRRSNEKDKQKETIFVNPLLEKEKLRPSSETSESEDESGGKRKLSKRLTGSLRGKKSTRTTRIPTIDMYEFAREEREVCPEGMECTSMDPTHYLLYQHTPL